MSALVRMASLVRRNDDRLARFERSMVVAGALALAATAGAQAERRVRPPAPATSCGPYVVGTFADNALCSYSCQVTR